MKGSAAGSVSQPPAPPSPILVAPTEPPTLKKLGKVTLTPESFGVDYLWFAHDRTLCGVQRKQFPGDFVASMDDGRMSRELAQMLRIHERGGFACLIVEGQPSWGRDGELVDGYKRFSRDRFESFLASLQLRYGVGYWVTDTTAHTGRLISNLHAWTQTANHNSLCTRPKSPNKWGLESRMEQAAHFLQGLPACGPVRAKAIVEHFETMPIGWRVGVDDLRAVPGIGAGVAARWHRFLGGGMEDPAPSVRRRTTRVEAAKVGGGKKKATKPTTPTKPKPPPHP